MAPSQFNIPCPLISRALPIILKETERLASYSKKFRLKNSSSSAGEKKRNKLGYQRTSTACVHCRRRKIRCLLAADDPQGRCESCIRLKRVCIFSPADHKPSMEKKRQTESSMDPFLAVPSTSPPPSMTSVSIETPSIYRNPQSVTSGAAELDSTPITSSSSLSQVATGVTQPQFEPTPPFDPIAPWDDPIMPAANPKATQEMCTQSDTDPFVLPMIFSEYLFANPQMLTPPEPEASNQFQPGGLNWQMQSQNSVIPPTPSEVSEFNGYQQSIPLVPKRPKIIPSKSAMP